MPPRHRNARQLDGLALELTPIPAVGSRVLGVLTPGAEMLTDEGLTAHRAAYCNAIREYHAQGKPAGKLAKWPLRYLIRHTAYHALDHSWEMEDKNLAGA